jgi:hypothetical protein
MQLGVVVEQRRPIQQARSTSTSVTWISTSITEGGNPVLSATFGAASATHQRSGGDSRLSLPPDRATADEGRRRFPVPCD